MLFTAYVYAVNVYRNIDLHDYTSVFTDTQVQIDTHTHIHTPLALAAKLGKMQAASAELPQRTAYGALCILCNKKCLA